MPRTLLLVLDGLSLDALDILTRDSERGAAMPYLGRLKDSGFFAPLDSPPHARPASIWGSLLTGRIPGSHGVFDAWCIQDDGDHVLRLPMDYQGLQVETMFSIATRQGLSTAGLNIPLTPHTDEDLPEAGFSWEGDELATEREQCALPATMAAQEDRLSSLARWKLDRGGHDIMVLRLEGPARLPGTVWQGLNGEEESDCLVEALLRYFAGLDRRIRYLVNAAGRDTRLLVVSTHGVATATTVVRINSLLARLGHLARIENPSGVEAVEGCNWRETNAWLPWAGSNGVAIRLAKGPEGPGIDPNRYETFRAELIRECLALEGNGGKPVIAGVYLREEAFSGHCLTEALDLLLVAEPGIRLAADLEGAEVEELEAASRIFLPQGFFIASGPDFQSGGDSTPIKAEDVTPLLLHLAGLPIPEDIEGTVPGQCLAPAWLESNPVTSGPPTLPVLDGRLMEGGLLDTGDADGESGEEAVKERLRALGYL